MRLPSAATATRRHRRHGRPPRRRRRPQHHGRVVPRRRRLRCIISPRSVTHWAEVNGNSLARRSFQAHAACVDRSDDRRNVPRLGTISRLFTRMDRGQFGAHRRGMVCLSLAVVGGPPARSCLVLCYALALAMPAMGGDADGDITWGVQAALMSFLGVEHLWKRTVPIGWPIGAITIPLSIAIACLFGAVANLSYAVGIASCWLVGQEAAWAPSCSSRFDCRGQPGAAGRRDAMCRIRPRHLLSGLRLLDCRSSFLLRFSVAVRGTDRLEPVSIPSGTGSICVVFGANCACPAIGAVLKLLLVLRRGALGGPLVASILVLNLASDKPVSLQYSNRLLLI